MQTSKLKEIIIGFILMFVFCYCNAQNWAKVYTDPDCSFIDTATIGKKKFIMFIKENCWFLLNAKGDTILQKKGFYTHAEFKDFDGNGYKDILVYHSGYAPETVDLFLYDLRSRRFVEIHDFWQFPAPEKIAGSSYYFSYHKSGCADLDWDSDLFFIQQYKVVRAGNISGRECEDEGVERGLFIYSRHKDKKALIEKLPLQIPIAYKNNKQGFIRDYWYKNYKLFKT